MIRLGPLNKGDLIGIAAPAGPFVREKFLRGVRNLKKAGFRVTYGRGIFARNGYLAGKDVRRSRELNRLLSDPKIKAVLFARGGYGTQRLLPSLKKTAPKIVVGLSDLTVLSAALWRKYRLPTLYGPMVAPQLSNQKSMNRLRRILTDPQALLRQSLQARKVLQRGAARGRLVGGCLSLVVSLIGTPYDIETRGSILFLEDTEEPPYAVDRMLTQLRQAGKFQGVKGIVLGTFRLKSRRFPDEILRVCREELAFFRGPILWGVRFGHHPDPLVIPFGGIGCIVGNRLKIEGGYFDATI